MEETLVIVIILAIFFFCKWWKLKRKYKDLDDAYEELDNKKGELEERLEQQIHSQKNQEAYISSLRSKHEEDRTKLQSLESTNILLKGEVSNMNALREELQNWKNKYYNLQNEKIQLSEYNKTLTNKINDFKMSLARLIE